MEKRKVAIILHSKGEKFETDFEAMKTYANPEFDAKKVEAVFNEVLSDAIYTENM